MKEIIYNFYKVLNKEQKKRFILLQFLVASASIFEVFTVAYLGFFMSSFSQEKSSSNFIFNFLKNILGVSSYRELEQIVLLSLFLCLIASAILSIVTIRTLSIFASTTGAEFGNRLFSSYLFQNISFHENVNSSELVNKISTEVNRVTDNILQPLMQIIARTATVILIAIFLFLYNTTITIVSIIVILFIYFVLFSLMKTILLKNGNIISKNSILRLKLMDEAFAGIKEITILGKKEYFSNKFKLSGDDFARAYGSSNTIYNIPRIIIEFSVYAALVTLIYVFTFSDNTEFSKYSALVSVFGFGLFKILPSFQQIYAGLAQMSANTSAFVAIVPELQYFVDVKFVYTRNNTADRFYGDITLSNVCFRYENSVRAQIENVTIEIPEYSKVGIVGRSGSGKSTLMNIMMGTALPQSGRVTIGKRELDNLNMACWHSSIGYVSQNPIVLDTTLIENIAIGEELLDIDMERIQIALRGAKLEEWVKTKEKGLYTLLGERGIQMSGGQRQRIAIARAIYREPDYFFFDEATSALDSSTEEGILEFIDKMKGKKTIVVIAHRINTVRDCDLIFVVENGGIKNFGSFDYLKDNCDEFISLLGKNKPNYNVL